MMLARFLQLAIYVLTPLTILSVMVWQQQSALLVIGTLSIWVPVAWLLARFGLGQARRKVSHGCDLRLLIASDSNPEDEIIDEFKMEFKSKKDQCAVLIVRTTSDSDRWTIAGYNDAGKFRTEVIDNPHHKLWKELKKEPHDECRIIKLALSRLGRTLSQLICDNARTLHVITVDPDGVPVDPTTYDALEFCDFEAQLDMIVDAIEASKKTKLLIFVHGGLNNRAAGQQHVDTLQGPIAEDGYYPLFLNWNSDLLDASIEDLIYIRQGRVARHWGPATALIYLIVDLGYGILRTPLVWGQMLSGDLNATGLNCLSFPGKRNSAALETELLSLSRENAASFAIVRGPNRISRFDSIAHAVAYLLTLPFKLCTSPLIDGFGQRAWRNMLRRTQMLFHREDEFDVRDYRHDGRRLRKMLTGKPKGAIFCLFNRLATYLNTHPDIEVTLIGHSMGTIVLNRALREFPTFRVNHLVYMAAACSIDDFRTSVVPYLLNSIDKSDRGHTQTQFYNLMLHPAAEMREWQGKLLDLTPRGSLLVWIDNFLSAPQTTLDRTLGCWENVIQTAHVIPHQVRSIITLKSFCVGRRDCQAPTTHGAFTDKKYKFWSQRFWRI